MREQFLLEVNGVSLLLMVPVSLIISSYINNFHSIMNDEN